MPSHDLAASNGTDEGNASVPAMALIGTPAREASPMHGCGHSLSRRALSGATRQGIPVLVALWLVVILFQVATGTYYDDFYYEDTAPHFVTGVMVADYLRTSVGTNPLAFAEQYYLRSPKVAFGRWPPLFHIVQGVVYLVFGTSKLTALVLIALISALLMAVTYYRADRYYGMHIAVVAVVLLAGSFIVRWHSRIVMSDLLTALFCSLAVLTLADYLQTRKPSQLAQVGLWTVLGLLTKETAVHLLILMPIVFLVAGRSAGSRDWHYGALVVGVLMVGIGILAFRLFAGLGVHGFQGVGQLVRHITTTTDHQAILQSMFVVAPPFAFFLAGCGLAVNEIRPASREITVHLRICAAWIAAVVLFFFVSPSPPEERYFIPLLIPLTFLIAHLCHSLRESFAPRSFVAGWLVPTVVAAVAILTSPQTNQAGIRGYAPPARAIPIDEGVVTLISSNAFGEGAFITERLLFDRKQRGIVLRGSKMLAASDWGGTNYQLLRKSAEEVREFLNEFPVHYVVLDQHQLTDTPISPDRILLRQTLDSFPEEFRRLGAFPIHRGNQEIEQSVMVYENIAARGRSAGKLTIRMLNGFERSLQLKTDPAAKRKR